MWTKHSAGFSKKLHFCVSKRTHLASLWSYPDNCLGVLTKTGSTLRKVVGVPTEISNGKLPNGRRKCDGLTQTARCAKMFGIVQPVFWDFSPKAFAVRSPSNWMVTVWTTKLVPWKGQQTILSHHVQTSLLSNIYQHKKGRCLKLSYSAAVETFRSIKMRRNKQRSVYTHAKCNLNLWNYYNPLLRHWIYPPARHSQ